MQRRRATSSWRTEDIENLTLSPRILKNATLRPTPEAQAEKLRWKRNIPHVGTRSPRSNVR
ncbi:hypothetical protein DIPPA_19638 [Diplonema papillatum]|nr:hypothetical protein DIPPA_19632 [Diplonema papillatum]KAJ9459883.1 hypothetical protein DIPPA_19638 [Diplonema papillatum]